MNKKEHILNETYLLYSEYGYALSLSQVTSKLGLKKQSIYNYFDSKDDLITQMLEYRIELYYDKLSNILYSSKDMTVTQRLDSVLTFVVDFYKNPARIKVRRWLMLPNTQNKMSSVFKKTVHYEEQFFDQLRVIIQEGIDSGEIKLQDKEEVLMTYIILIRGMIDGLMAFSDFDYEDITNKMIEKFWRIVN